jgi:hypothetical protein
MHVLSFSHYETHSHSTQTHKEKCVCVCAYVSVIAQKASNRRARRFIGGVSWPESRVQVRQTTKQVVVQRFGLTSDRFQNFDF